MGALVNLRSKKSFLLEPSNKVTNRIKHYRHPHYFLTIAKFGVNFEAKDSSLSD